MIQDYVVFTGVNILLAWSVYIILLSGSLSFANGGFMAIGAYISGVLTVKFGVALVVSAAIAGVVAGVFGVLVGYPALRTRGLYLILVTVGITISVKAVIESIDYVGSIQGFGGMVGSSPWHVVAIVAIVGCGLWWLSRSPFQRILDAVREDELVASALGVRRDDAGIGGIAGAEDASRLGAFQAGEVLEVEERKTKVLPRRAVRAAHLHAVDHRPVG